MVRFMREMVVFIQESGHTVLSEHVVADDPISALAEKIGKNRFGILPEDIERQDIAWLDQATHVIAEISSPSTGTGREIEYARVKGLLGKTPAAVLCLYRKDREGSASAMIRGMISNRYPNVRVLGYQDICEAETYIGEFLGL